MLKRVFGTLSCIAASFFVAPLMAFAEEAATSGGSDYKMGLAIAAGLGMAIAAFGGALGQGKAASAALEGMARNPEASGKLFVPMILCLVFVESLVLFTFAICFILQGKI